jgi:MFS transporter, OFA family, oxalate/formate antiporter
MTATQTPIPSSKLPNRWVIAVAVVIMQICLGAAYGWSVFRNPLMAAEHWTETSVQLNFTFTIVALGFGTILGGLWQDKVGPRKVASVAGVLYGLGYIAAALAAREHSLAGLYLGYGALSGFGMGMAYICPIATMVKWFPDMRGLMTGVTVCGYGFGSAIMSPLAAWEIIHHGVPETFLALGVVYLIVVVLTAQLLVNPPPGWRPAGWEPSSAVSKAATTYNFTVQEALGTWQFYLLFAILVFNVSAGIMIISQASPMAQEMVGMTVLKAAGMVGLISICNGLGRVFWAWVSDHLGRARVYFLLYLIQAIVFFSLPRVHDVTLFSICFALIGLCYGGGFGTMPSFTADFFGEKHVGGIYGIVLFGWAFASIPAPVMIAHIHQGLGRYAPAINIIAVVLVCAMVLPLLARRPMREAAAQQPAEAITTN